MRTHRPSARGVAPLLSVVALVLALPSPIAAQSFVNFETPHVHPLDLTPSGHRLLAVNTAAGRLEVFNSEGAQLVPLRSIAVGVDPVSVRARNDGEAWVVNHVSDSISIVDLASGRVKATLATHDEPCDVVFAGTGGLDGGPRAFVTCSAPNEILVYEPTDPSAAPLVVDVFGEDPRALAVSPDGSTVYAAIFESGNGSTILGGGSTMAGGFPPNVVSDAAGPYGGTNPPPNAGAAFEPPKKAGNPAPPAVGLIVKRDGAGQWMDDNGGDWTALVSGAQAAQSGRPVGWTLPDHDVAVLDADTLALSYVDRLMNIVMALGVNPATGVLAAVGTDATNEVRFEPNLTGTFVRVELALHDPSVPSSSLVDLNPQLDYSTSSVPQATRDLALGDPRGIAWTPDGFRAWVTGLGSDNVVVVDQSGARAGLAQTIEVGEGPTGIVMHPAGRAYVLAKHDASISVLDVATESELSRVPLFDPTPLAIRTGRKHLYSTHLTSGLGQASCGSCHVDARMDRLAWDLGDPSGDVKSVSGQNLSAGLPLGTSFVDWHPMKGPMTTQTLQDIVGKEPHHWRGDRDGIEEFANAFAGLLGDDQPLPAGPMQEFEDFLATIHFPPNPYRNLDNTLPTALSLDGHSTSGRFGPAGQPLGTGDAQHGLTLYRPPNLLDSQGVACVTCHTNPTGLGTDSTLSLFTFVPIAPGPLGERHHALVSVDGSTNVSLKIPQLRNLYDKVGMEFNQAQNRAGFGFLHDGSVDSLARFVSEPVFSVTSDQDVADLVAFMLAFAGSDLPAGSTSGFALEPPGTASRDAHAAVGVQSTLVSAGAPAPGQIALLDALQALANANDIGLVAKGWPAGLPRGYAYVGGGTWVADRAGETISTAALRATASPGHEVTFTAVPKGSETRLGVDRDEDGFRDRDELDALSDPDDASSTPMCTPAGKDLGYAKAGGDGRFPRFTACGELSSGHTADVLLQDARPNASAYLVLSLAAGFLPFQGGTLVPLPDFVLGPVPTDGTGQIFLPGVAGGGGPANLYVQWVIVDPGAYAGRAMSNALELHYLP